MPERKNVVKTTIENLTLKQSEIKDLATGEWDEETAAKLNASELYRRMLHIHTLYQEINGQKGIMGQLAPFERGLEVLQAAERKDAAVTHELLLHPTVGQWLGDMLRRLGSGIGDTTRPLWADLGYVHALAAVAAYRVGSEIVVQIPLHNGQAVLPMLGRATLSFKDSWEVATVRVEKESITIANGTGSVIVPEYPNDSGPGWEGARWLEFVASNGQAWRVLLNDFDEFTSLRVPAVPERLSEQAFEGWYEVLGEAWELLVQDHPKEARQLSGANGLKAIVPAPPKARFQTFSASSGDSPGSATMSRPHNPVEAAVTLIHEHCGHNMLNSLLCLVPLLAHPEAQMKEEYAPWRDDPRPLAGLFHGVKAFSVVVKFWHDRLAIDKGADGNLAALEFAHWRNEVYRGARTLLARPDDLTEHGDMFIRLLQEDLIGPLLEVSVPHTIQRIAGALGLDHLWRWASHHVAVPDTTLSTATAAWLAGSPEPPAELFEEVRELTPYSDARGLDVVTVLVRLGIVDPHLLNRPGLLPQEATPGDIALAISLLEQPNSPIGKWEGLDQIMSRILEAQRGCPQDVLAALYDRINRLTKQSPSIETLAQWLSKGMIAYLRRQGDEALLPRYQRQESEQAVREILERTTTLTKVGELSAFEATRLLIAQGYLAIGTAASQEAYRPKVLMTNIPDHEVGSTLELSEWRQRPVDRRVGMPVVRASRVTETAVWSAAVGDPHIPFQREQLGISFLQPNKEYVQGYGGWYYDSHSLAGGYIPIAHEDLVNAIDSIAPETIIGAVDFIKEDASFTKEVPYEPGQVVSRLSHKTVASIPVRAADIHVLLPKVQTYSYQPQAR